MSSVTGVSTRQLRVRSVPQGDSTDSEKTATVARRAIKGHAAKKTSHAATKTRQIKAREANLTVHRMEHPATEPATEVHEGPVAHPAAEPAAEVHEGPVAHPAAEPAAEVHEAAAANPVMEPTAEVLSLRKKFEKDLLDLIMLGRSSSDYLSAWAGLRSNRTGQFSDLMQSGFGGLESILERAPVAIPIGAASIGGDLYFADRSRNALIDSAKKINSEIDLMIAKDPHFFDQYNVRLNTECSDLIRSPNCIAEAEKQEWTSLSNLILPYDRHVSQARTLLTLDESIKKVEKIENQARAMYQRLYSDHPIPWGHQYVRFGLKQCTIL